MAPKVFISSGSHHTRRVRLLMHELGLELDTEEVAYGPDGFGGESRAAFLELNPNGKVPVLEDGGLIVWESNAIMGYLADLHGETPLWPRDPGARAQVSMWQFWQAAHLSPAADGLFYENFVKSMMGGEADPNAVATSTEAFHRWAAVLDARLANETYVALGCLTCADLSIAAALMYADKSAMPVDAHPHLAAWLARIKQRPSWAATEPSPPPAS